MKGTRNLTWIIVGVIVLILFMAGCGSYNGLVKSDQSVQKTWGNVETNYQRRTDLYNSVIKTIEASANFEKSLLKDVVEARAKLGGVTVNTSDQASLDKYQQAQ